MRNLAKSSELSSELDTFMRVAQDIYEGNYHPKLVREIEPIIKEFDEDQELYDFASIIGLMNGHLNPNHDKILKSTGLTDEEIHAVNTFYLEELEKGSKNYVKAILAEYGFPVK